MLGNNPDGHSLFESESRQCRVTEVLLGVDFNLAFRIISTLHLPQVRRLGPGSADGLQVDVFKRALIRLVQQNPSGLEQMLNSMQAANLSKVRRGGSGGVSRAQRRRMTSTPLCWR